MKPILFSTDMVKALLEGRKTMTRRIVKGAALEWLVDFQFVPEFVSCRENNLCPYRQPGEILWVRETWENYQGAFNYKAGNYGLLGERWKPSIFMPRAACRLFLEITNVRVERLQDISEEDAIAEGVEKVDDSPFCWKNYLLPNLDWIDAKGSYQSLWQKINGPESWDLNPWVWVISFKRIVNPIPLIGE